MPERRKEEILINVYPEVICVYIYIYIYIRIC